MTKQLPPAGPDGDHFLDESGSEVVDSTPMAPPIGYNPTPSMIDHIRNLIRRELSEHADQVGAETFEEADDFDVGDDYDPTSPYEEVFEPNPPVGAPQGLAEAQQPAAATPPASSTSPAAPEAPEPQISNS